MALEYKEHILSLPEEQMIVIAEEYANAINDTLKKSIKEISSKCYQVTLAIANKKTIGFGRNQKEASTNALKKLLDHIATNQLGSKILNQTFNMSEEQRKIDLKIMDLSKFNQKNKNTFTNNTNKTKISLVSQIPQKSLVHSHYKSINQRYSIDNLQEKQKKEKSQSKVYSELVQAKAYIVKLQAQIQQLKLENKMLKVNNDQRSYQYPKDRVLSEINLNNVQVVDENDQKKRVPKLNLESLPNYHGKSRKSLNQSMVLPNKKK